MQLYSWDEAGLGPVGDEIAAAFEPFIGRKVEADDPEWSRDLRRRKLRILREYLGRRLLGWLPNRRRTTEAIIAEYDETWRVGHARYRLDAPARLKPWIWRGQRLYASSLGATRFRQVILARILERLKPRSVLEVGCGDGINLILLACRFPEIRFTGLELTPEGYKAATDFQKADRLPEAMQAYAPLPLVDPSAFRSIRFVQGTAADLPFPDNLFDLTMTVLALEQMERIRDEAIREIVRVTRGHSLMIEPFREANDRGWPRLNVIRRDYLRGRVGHLARYGLQPELAIDDYPQELFLRTSTVLARKRVATVR